jgi:hypothetical protein
MKKILVIVDMQTGFPAAKDKDTLFAVGQEIRKAIDDDNLIIFLEYVSISGNNYGKTNKLLLDLVNKYKNYVIGHKSQDDGSDIVKGICDTKMEKHPKNQFYPSNKVINFQICGVNKGACVASTIRGLTTLYPNAIITLIEGACNCDCCGVGLIDSQIQGKKDGYCGAGVVVMVYILITTAVVVYLNRKM